MDYTELDETIINVIANAEDPLWHASTRMVARDLALGTKREPFRIIDCRLQALRKKGAIVYRTKAQAAAEGTRARWSVVSKGEEQK